MSIAVLSKATKTLEAETQNNNKGLIHPLKAPNTDSELSYLSYNIPMIKKGVYHNKEDKLNKFIKAEEGAYNLSPQSITISNNAITIFLKSILHTDKIVTKTKRKYNVTIYQRYPIVLLCQCGAINIIKKLDTEKSLSACDNPDKLHLMQKITKPNTT